MSIRRRAAVSGALRGVGLVAGGTAAGQAVAVAATPVLARMYDAAAFGLFALISSIALTIGTVAALRYEMAIPAAETEESAQRLAVVGLACCGAVALALGIPLAAGGAGAIADHFTLGRVSGWLVFAPLMGAFVGANLVLTQLAVRHRRYGASGRRALVQSVSTVVGQTGLGLINAGLGGLCVGFLVGQGAAALSLAGGVRLEARRRRGIGGLISAARAKWRFPILLAPAALINVLGLQVPILLMAHYYGAIETGWLSMTQRVLGAPLILISSAVSQVYMGEFATAARDDPSRALLLFRKATHRLLPVGVIVAVVVHLGAPTGFQIALGKEWAESGQYGQALALALGVQVLAVPLSHTLILVGRNGLQLTWDAARLVVTIVAIGAAHRWGASDAEAVWAFGVSSACLYGSHWLLAHWSVHRFERDAKTKRAAVHVTREGLDNMAGQPGGSA